ncbi:MAG: iron complex outermembrane receptor protein [Psychromonas sp.]|jgi:iron complex outermembrane receptor protein|uniref:hypothetical protein n=1 Tax=Psychromonas sp. TaxID=1884585 RepID=UPI0039E3328A
MFINSKLAKSIRLATTFGIASSGMFVTNIVIAQSANDTADTQKISVTGSHILRPCAVTTSPIMLMDSEEIAFLQ